MACARIPISCASKGRRLIYAAPVIFFTQPPKLQRVSLMYKTSLLNSTGSDDFRRTECEVDTLQKLRAGMNPALCQEKPLSSDRDQLMMLVDIERPFVEKPFVPKQGDDIPEIPDKGLAVEVSFGEFSVHVMDSQSPVPKIYYIVDNITYNHQD